MNGIIRIVRRIEKCNNIRGVSITTSMLVPKYFSWIGHVDFTILCC